ncbi:hypothetical protein J2S00_003326 [Caldalkalibacillus uzonensis]|uniref:DUF4367 domain-containing protein n=1 Tax=Caldalkalibacillus uzonensis TaxID=353224 RepID=A0ABU0CVR6_9BACI|nr:DUF4367 domain-containing protein [Caldalkalibacillus uzonensis]MDQ0340511.1 hypothetical protein [Caldalkalibacillus uzonensis]
MNKQEWDTEKNIQIAIQEDYENTPEPPLSKEETWNHIQNTIATRKNKPFQQIRKMIAVVILCAVMIITLFQSLDVSANSWVSQLITKAKGTVTQLIGSVGEPTPLNKNQPPPDIIHYSGEVKLVTMSLEEAQEVTSFSIVLPSHVPEGFNLRDVTVELVDDEKSDQIILNYVKGEETLTIRETNIQEQMGYSIGVDHEDTKIIDVDIQGNSGTLFIFKDNSKKLIWVDQDLQFIIDSQLSEHEIKKVANTM